MTNEELRAHGTHNLLTALVMGEAEGEDFIGKLAVGCVVRNRTKDNRWPSTVDDVILQPYQFSCFNEDNARYSVVLASIRCGNNFGIMAWRESRAVGYLITGNWCSDITWGANHYHAVDCTPHWADEIAPCYAHGRHIFYRL